MNLWKRLASKEDENKFRELVLYISQKCANDPSFGAVKLNKILFFSDFMAYGYFGVPITGLEYQKLDKGPAPRRLLPIREQMLKSGELGIQELPYGSFIQKRPVNLRPPNLDLFKANEIALVDEVIEAFDSYSGKSLSQFSHSMPGWDLPQIGETIPYELVFVSDTLLTEDDIVRGSQIAKELNLFDSSKT